MLVSFCRHHLKELSNLTGETAHLGVREGRQALFIDHHTSRNQVIAVTGRTGEFMPLHSTVHGKALLADCGVTELQAIVGSEPLTVYTPGTISSIDELACASIRTKGYSLDEAEHIAGVPVSLLRYGTGRGELSPQSASLPRRSGFLKNVCRPQFRRVTEASTRITEVFSA
jgi:IclR family acetate operon transcriptional repressor